MPDQQIDPSFYMFPCAVCGEQTSYDDLKYYYEPSKWEKNGEAEVYYFCSCEHGTIWRAERAGEPIPDFLSKDPLPKKDEDATS